jgi:hypothetical protein
VCACACCPNCSDVLRSDIKLLRGGKQGARHRTIGSIGSATLSDTSTGKIAQFITWVQGKTAWTKHQQDLQRRFAQASRDAAPGSWLGWVHSSLSGAAAQAKPGKAGSQESVRINSVSDAATGPGDVLSPRSSVTGVSNVSSIGPAGNEYNSETALAADDPEGFAGSALGGNDIDSIRSPRGVFSVSRRPYSAQGLSGSADVAISVSRETSDRLAVPGAGPYRDTKHRSPLSADGSHASLRSPRLGMVRHRRSFSSTPKTSADDSDVGLRRKGNRASLVHSATHMVALSSGVLPSDSNAASSLHLAVNSSPHLRAAASPRRSILTPADAADVTIASRNAGLPSSSPSTHRNKPAHPLGIPGLKRNMFDALRDMTGAHGVQQWHTAAAPRPHSSGPTQITGRGSNNTTQQPPAGTHTMSLPQSNSGFNAKNGASVQSLHHLPNSPSLYDVERDQRSNNPRPMSARESPTTISALPDPVSQHSSSSSSSALFGDQAEQQSQNDAIPVSSKVRQALRRYQAGSKRTRAKLGEIVDSAMRSHSHLNVQTMPTTGTDRKSASLHQDHNDIESNVPVLPPLPDSIAALLRHGSQPDSWDVQVLRMEAKHEPDARVGDAQHCCMDLLAGVICGMDAYDVHVRIVFALIEEARKQNLIRGSQRHVLMELLQERVKELDASFHNGEQVDVPSMTLNIDEKLLFLLSRADEDAVTKSASIHNDTDSETMTTIDRTHRITSDQKNIMHALSLAERGDVYTDCWTKCMKLDKPWKALLRLGLRASCTSSASGNTLLDDNGDGGDGGDGGDDDDSHASSLAHDTIGATDSTWLVQCVGNAAIDFAQQTRRTVEQHIVGQINDRTVQDELAVVLARIDARVSELSVQTLVDSGSDITVSPDKRPMTPMHTINSTLVLSSEPSSPVVEMTDHSDALVSPICSNASSFRLLLLTPGASSSRHHGLSNADGRPMSSSSIHSRAFSTPGVPLGRFHIPNDGMSFEEPIAPIVTMSAVKQTSIEHE